MKQPQNRVVIYRDLDGVETILSDAPDTLVIRVDETKQPRVRQDYTRVSSGGIIEAILSDQPQQGSSEKATASKKTKARLRIVGGKSDS